MILLSGQPGLGSSMFVLSTGKGKGCSSMGLDGSMQAAQCYSTVSTERRNSTVGSRGRGDAVSSECSRTRETSQFVSCGAQHRQERGESDRQWHKREKIAAYLFPSYKQYTLDMCF